MKSSNMTKSILLLIASITLASCDGQNTFSEYARAGDTLAIAAGWKPGFNKNNITVKIYPFGFAAGDTPITIAASDPAIRAIVNLYPDPVSSMNVSQETGQDLTPSATTYTSLINAGANDDRDWFQTTVFLDLPPTLPVGKATIVVENDTGTTFITSVQIIDGVGQKNTFKAKSAGPLSEDMIAILERASHFTIEFESVSLPHAVEINMAHNDDTTTVPPGIGKAFAINPTGFKKNLTWTDNGTNMKAILLPAEETTITSIKDYKFYVAGGISGLILTDVTGYDINGDVMTDPITATITASN